MSEQELKPAPSGVWKTLAAIGPGIVVTGSVIGAGELVNTTQRAAEHGFALLWAVLIACVIKCLLQVEIARHALVHNRTPFEALNSLPGPKWRGTSIVGPIFVAGAVLSSVALAGILRLTAGVVHSAVSLPFAGPYSLDVWTLIVFAVSFGLLWQGTYANIEKLVTLLVGGFSLSVVVGLALIQASKYHITGPQFLSGLTFSFGEDRQAAGVAVVSLMGALGATGNELFMYPYWILEKGYGKMVGSPHDSGWLKRAQGWIRVLQVDVFVCTFLATITTLGYFLMGAAVFYGRQRPAGDAVIEQLSSMYTETYGPWSRGLFLLGAFCTLFSTLIVGTAAFARMWCDMCVSLGWLPRDNSKVWRRAIRGFQSAYLIGYLAITFVSSTAADRLVFWGQYISGVFGTPLLMIAICGMAFRTDARVRMGRVSGVLLVASVVVIAACLIGSFVG